jgi:hypothetical protein
MIGFTPTLICSVQTTFPFTLFTPPFNAMSLLHPRYRTDINWNGSNFEMWIGDDTNKNGFATLTNSALTQSGIVGGDYTIFTPGTWLTSGDGRDYTSSLYPVKAYCLNAMTVGASLDWTAGSGNEYYAELQGGGNPNLSQPLVLYENGTAINSGSGGIGGLSSGEWAWGDPGTGFNTLVVNLTDDTDPDTKADGFLKAENTTFKWATTGQFQAYFLVLDAHAF